MARNDNISKNKNKNKEKELTKSELQKIVASLENDVKIAQIDYNNILDVKINFHADIGSTILPLFEFIKIQKGYVIDLNKAAGESVDLFISDKMIGKGDVMVYEKNLAVRINEVLTSSTVVSHI